MYLSQTSSFWNHSPGWFKALGHIHTNPGKKVSGFKNVRGRVDGAKCNGRSRPSNKKVGGGRGEGSKKKSFLTALWSSVWSKNKGGGGVGHQGPSPGSATEMQLYGTVFLCLVCANSREWTWCSDIQTIFVLEVTSMYLLQSLVL